MSINARWRNVKRRRKCNSILWIFYCCCFINGLNLADGAYAEADDLVNELDRPSEYTFNSTYVIVQLKISPQRSECAGCFRW